MNRLDDAILDQYRRIDGLRSDVRTGLDEAKGEIMAVATPELTLEILEDARRCTPYHETSSLTAQMRAFDNDRSMTSRTMEGVRVAHSLGRIGMTVPDQGYVGGIARDIDEYVVYGHSMIFRGLKHDDPIQQAAGDTFYPPMMWVKALRAVAYVNRPESAGHLTLPAYLAELGLTLGCGIGKYGDVMGATGFMPGERLQGLGEDSLIGEHLLAEPVEAFRLSGLCDQGVVNPDVLMHTPDFARGVIQAGGSLN